MQTNFFQSIYAIQVAGDWKINIARENNERLIVSVLFFNNEVGDNAKLKVPPIILKGTAQEIDEGFFAAIQQPIQETAQLFTNMEQYLKQREIARKESAMEKEKATKAEKEKTDKQKKYEEAMKKVAELEAEGKHRDAWMKVPDPEAYPDKADEIRERKTSLSRQFAPDLFNA